MESSNATPSITQVIKAVLWSIGIPVIIIVIITNEMGKIFGISAIRASLNPLKQITIRVRIRIKATRNVLIWPYTIWLFMATYIGKYPRRDSLILLPAGKTFPN